MKKPDATVQNVFTRNRAEELELDVWKDFVIPPFFSELDIDSSNKPRIIIGGRGCGKTMLLRYLSYHTQFSADRAREIDEPPQIIGLYWRADTQFLKTLSGRGIHADVWESIFEYFLTLKIALEVIESIIYIAKSPHRCFAIGDIESLRFDDFSEYSGTLSGNIFELRDALRALRRRCEFSISNPRDLPSLEIVPSQFLRELVMQLREKLSPLSQSVFHIYIDEYENLREYQQMVINTRIKHSEPPLIYNIAMKANGIKTKRIVGEESISNLHDYREHNLDSYLNRESSFELFAAEILLFRLSVVSGVKDLLDEELLKDPRRLAERGEQSYKERLIPFVKQMLPGLSNEELADKALSDRPIRNQIERELKKVLTDRKCGISFDKFIDESFSKASIVNIALLNRQSQSVSDIQNEFEKHRKGEESKYTGTTSWIHNNFVGSYLRLYRPFNRTCPYYSGFEVFTKLSRGNIRHFLELIRACTKDVRVETDFDVPRVSPERQALAAKRASEDLLGEIDSFGTMGLLLSRFVNEIGRIFGYAHGRASQSEPEINHFSISDDLAQLTDQDNEFFNEAEKWGVLFPEKSTKDKSDSDSTVREFVLNPIYAPYFLLSYAKKRKINLTIGQVRIILHGGNDDRKVLRDSFIDKYKSEFSSDLEDNSHPQLNL